MQLNDGKGEYPFTDDCDRVENGVEATNNRASSPESVTASQSNSVETSSRPCGHTVLRTGVVVATASPEV